MTSYSPEEVAGRLEAFLREQFGIRNVESEQLRRANLWEEGYVDSTGIVEIIAFLESSFELVLPDEVLFDPEFTTIGGIAACVARTLGENAA